MPKEYSEIAQKSVLAAISSWKNGSLDVTPIEGYEQDPTALFAEQFADGLTLIYENDISYIRTQIHKAVFSYCVEDMVIEEIEIPQTVIQGEAFVVFVKVRHGYTTLEFEVDVVVS